MKEQIPWSGDMKSFVARKIAEIDATPPDQQLIMPWRCGNCQDSGYVVGEAPHPLNPETEITMAAFCFCLVGKANKRGTEEYYAAKKTGRPGRGPSRVKFSQE